MGRLDAYFPNCLGLSGCLRKIVFRSFEFVAFGCGVILDHQVCLCNSADPVAHTNSRGPCFLARSSHSHCLSSPQWVKWYVWRDITFTCFSSQFHSSVARQISLGLAKVRSVSRSNRSLTSNLQAVSQYLVRCYCAWKLPQFSQGSPVLHDQDSCDRQLNRYLSKGILFEVDSTFEFRQHRLYFWLPSRNFRILLKHLQNLQLQ